MSLALGLALLAVLLAVLALLVALRTERHVRRLALALAREWGLKTGAAGAQGVPASGSEDGEQAAHVRRSVAALEQQLHEVEERLARVRVSPPQPTSARSEALPVDADPRARVSAYLRDLGYADVVVFDGRGGGYLYEANEQGMPRKGAARVGADGQVTLGAPAAVRVFP